MSIPTSQANDVKAAIMAYVRQYYTGLKVSFSTDPVPGGSTPAENTSISYSSLGPNPYNVLQVWDDHGSSTGCAIGDSGGTNAKLENNAGPGPPSSLGAFIVTFANVYKLTAPGDIDKFSKYFAHCIAHEVGHSIGLYHNDDGNHIMNTLINPTGEPSFRAEDITFMQSILPGPGR
jgi:hypothetical protein